MSKKTVCVVCEWWERSYVSAIAPFSVSCWLFLSQHWYFGIKNHTIIHVSGMGGFMITGSAIHPSQGAVLTTRSSNYIICCLIWPILSCLGAYHASLVASR